MSRQRSNLEVNTTDRRPTSRRQVSRRERERRRQRLAIMISGGILLLVALLIIVPLIKRTVIDPRQTLAVVGDRTITRADYEKQQRLDNLGLSEPGALSQIFDAYQQDPQAFRQSIEEQLQQQRELAPGGTPVDPALLDLLVDAEVLVQSARQAGITLTDQEVSSKLNSYFAAALANDNNTAAGATSTAGPASTLTAIVPASPTAPSAPSTPVPTAVLPVPTNQQVAPFFDLLGDTIGVSRQDYERLALRPRLVRERYVEKNVPKTAEQVHVRHILVPTRAAAQDVLNQLKAGAKFEVLARQVSTDEQTKLKGGDLGWAISGAYQPGFDKAAFALKQPGQLGGPAETSFGWHVIQLLQRQANRPLTEEQRATLAEQKVQQFLTAQKTRLRQQNQLQISIPPTPVPTREPTAVPIPTGEPAVEGLLQPCSAGRRDVCDKLKRNASAVRIRM